MTINYKVLGQSAPSASTNTTLYAVPAATQAVVSTITACNRSASSGTYRIAVRPDGASINTQHYLVFDALSSPNETTALTLGITLGDTDVVTVYASSSLFTFNAFGSEIT